MPLSVPTKQIDQWSGIYWGGSFGGGFTHSRVASNERYVDTFPTNPLPFVTAGYSTNADADGSDGGALADIYLGTNQQIAPSIVVGLQLEGSVGDMSFDAEGTRAVTLFNDAGPTQTANGPFRPHIHAPFMISALALAGWLADPTTMIYGLAGWTGTHFKYENLTDNPFYEPKDQFWANGVTVGGGLEKKLAPNWSTRFEYRYTNFFASDASNDFQRSSTQPDSQTNTIRTRFSEDMQMGRIGISYLLAQ
jgi:opacity protein-like surface antigen